jgi:hypothetical protein
MGTSMRAFLLIAFALVSVPASAQSVAFCQGVAGGGPGYTSRASTPEVAAIYKRYQACLEGDYPGGPKDSSKGRAAKKSAK